MQPAQGHLHNRPAEGARGSAAQSIGHRAKAERQEGESQGQAASRIAHERNALRAGSETSVVVEAVFVSLSMSFTGVAVTGAPVGADDAGSDGAGAADVPETMPEPEAAVTDEAAAPGAPEDGVPDGAESGYTAYLTTFSAQVSYSSASIALQLLR